MPEITPSALLAQLNWRYAVKKFDDQKKIPDERWKAMEETLVLTPSSYGLQPWKFFEVASPDLRRQLLPNSWNQAQVVDCSHFVVFGIKKGMSEADIDRFIGRTAEVRGIAKESIEGYRRMMISDLVTGPRSKYIDEWATRQAYIALGNAMTAAALLGIDSCPMEGINPPKYDEILGLPSKGYATVVACAFGYRSDADKYAHAKKVRFPIEQLIERL